ncbi:MAG TPA: hypothetical protein VK363_19285 [Pyrinomonadaceae bacterium]|nr:hypothetical protein [Pyrinomonadaceae bacterium]
MSSEKNTTPRGKLRTSIRTVRGLPHVTTETCYLEVISTEGNGLSRVGITREHRMIALMGGAKPPDGSLAVVSRRGLSDLIGFAYEVEGGVRVDWPDCEGHVWPNAQIVGQIIGIIGEAQGAAKDEADADEWKGFELIDA